jgi:hypothetical protein
MAWCLVQNRDFTLPIYMCNKALTVVPETCAWEDDKVIAAVAIVTTRSTSVVLKCQKSIPKVQEIEREDLLSQGFFCFHRK